MTLDHANAGLRERKRLATARAIEMGVFPDNAKAFIAAR